MMATHTGERNRFVCVVYSAAISLNFTLLVWINLVIVQLGSRLVMFLI